ncbi:unnamed protein product [Blepharisma stoltei]|uniref:Uncharacterized protein n=1 Tax=Blepharisma stoltei TaxID=1481888 RepID=A0AAU9JMC1_9CILI|nr:unnamed protein product [Blepharisma stoltei]
MESRESIDIDVSVKIVLVGDSQVGKSSLLSLFINEEFNQNIPTTHGIGNKHRTLELEGKVVKVDLWDVPGHIKYRPALTQFYNHASAAILIFDLSKRESFKNLNKWISELTLSGIKLPRILLVGNKSDKTEERDIDESDLQNFLKNYYLKYIETSAKTGENVEEAFMIALQKSLKFYEGRNESRSSTQVDARNREACCVCRVVCRLF